MGTLDLRRVTIPERGLPQTWKPGKVRVVPLVEGESWVEVLLAKPGILDPFDPDFTLNTYDFTFYISDDQEAYRRNAIEHLKDLKSMINDYLSNDSDSYIRGELLAEIDTIKRILVKL